MARLSLQREGRGRQILEANLLRPNEHKQSFVFDFLATFLYSFFLSVVMADAAAVGYRLRNVSPEDSLRMLFSMNQAMVDVCAASVRMERPNISDADLLKELKRIYRLRK